MSGSETKDKGYIFLDVLVGVLVFSLGFVVVLNLSSLVLLNESRAENYLKAVNIACSTMDDILNLHENQEDINNFIEQSQKDKYGKFKRTIVLTRDSPDLLVVKVKISWAEKGELREYLLESLFYVEE